MNDDDRRIADKMLIAADLDTTRCELWHPEDVPPLAIDYIVQTFENVLGESFQVGIPVCGDCIRYLKLGMLKLNYCINCGNSQWRINNDPNKNNEIYWKKVCPDCKED